MLPLCFHYIDRKARDVTQPPLRSININKYVFPATYGLVIDQKLKNCSKLTHRENSDLVRTLCVSFLPHTHAPDTDSVRKIIAKLLAKHPSLSYIDDMGNIDNVATEVFRFLPVYFSYS